MKLKAIQFDRPPTFQGLPLRGDRSLECDSPHDLLRGFRLVVRGPSLFLVSPPGWRSGAGGAKLVDGMFQIGDDPRAPRVAFETPRANAHLMWTFEPGEEPAAMISDFAKKASYESEPFDKPKISDQNSLLAQIPAKEE